MVKISPTHVIGENFPSVMFAGSDRLVRTISEIKIGESNTKYGPLTKFSQAKVFIVYMR